MSGRRWVVALAVLGAAGVVSALVLAYVAATIQIEAERFFATADPGDGGLVDEQTFARYNDLYIQATYISSPVSPLLVCGIATLFVMLGVLAHRWDARRATGQTEASAAS